MDQIGGKPGPSIQIYSPTEITFSFFFFLSGKIQMTITEGKKVKVFIFHTFEEFESKATQKGLPIEFIGTISLAYY